VAGFAIVIGWAMYTAFSAAQSIFLTKAGPHAYPLFFIVLALAVWPTAALQGALTRRFGVGRAFRITLIANAVMAIGIFTAYTLREDATVAFTAYVVYSVAFELVMLNFWSFVTQHFNVLEGKRIFPVIAAGSSVGYILSGLTTTIVAVFAATAFLDRHPVRLGRLLGIGTARARMPRAHPAGIQQASRAQPDGIRRPDRINPVTPD